MEAGLYVIGALVVLGTALVAWLVQRNRSADSGTREDLLKISARLDEQRQTQIEMRQTIAAFTEKQAASAEGLKLSLEQRHGEALKALQETLQRSQESASRQLAEALARSAEELGKRVDALTSKTDTRLQEISGAVEKRLSEGFEKTTATFADVVKRLALIDQAQAKITELSSNVVSLQQVLSDKKSRGAFGEVILKDLLRNLLPETAFALQHTLHSGERCDCILFLPPPTGHVVIDSKFPLENYQRMVNLSLPESERKSAEKQFKADVKKHLGDIARKYIVPGETSDGAVMFLPAEAVFAEIHAYHRDLVEESQRLKVWIASPTTLMAILTTARSVLKDAAMRERADMLKDQLVLLGKDFNRFQERMDSLVKYVRQAHDKAEEVSTSARKITGQFARLEKAELTQANGEPAPLALEND
jgi:DNA recombination protein RmuC